MFDVKYIHLFEPLLTPADEKQAIGRGTRFCGQKGLKFEPNIGWTLYVYKYDISLNTVQKARFNASTGEELVLKHSNINLEKLYFSSELEDICKVGAVDSVLTKNIHMRGGGIKGKRKKGLNINKQNPPSRFLNFNEMQEYVETKFENLAWDEVEIKNLCEENKNANDIDERIVKLTPTQEFVSKYFAYTSPYKGMLLWHSVGTGKTCTAVAVASRGFESHNYTILWVTRHTLKSSVWKNVFEKVCSYIIKRRLKNGELIDFNVKKGKLKYISPNWIMPISYKQFSNLLKGKNEYYKELVKRNGVDDPLRKTFIIIDEVHKLWASDLPPIERPDVNILQKQLHHSYEYSGKDSARLLLMTATPYTDDPMQMIKILNMLRTKEDVIPDNFDDFKEKFLKTESSEFTKKGYNDFLNKITGYISYLNRERDARQFAIPVIEKVYTPMSEDTTNELLNQKGNYDREIIEIKDTIAQTKDKTQKTELKNRLQELKGELKDIKKNITIQNKNNKSQEYKVAECVKK